MPEAFGEPLKRRPSTDFAFTPVLACIVQNTCHIELRQPIDGDGELVCELMEFPSSPGRELENTRATEAMVSDQQRAAGL